MPRTSTLCLAALIAGGAVGTPAYAGSFTTFEPPASSIVVIGEPAKKKDVKLGTLRTEEAETEEARQSEKKKLTLKERNEIRIQMRLERHNELAEAKREVDKD